MLLVSEETVAYFMCLVVAKVYHLWGAAGFFLGGAGIGGSFVILGLSSIGTKGQTINSLYFLK